jgi:hypothetical protein
MYIYIYLFRNVQSATPQTDSMEPCRVSICSRLSQVLLCGCYCVIVTVWLLLCGCYCVVVTVWLLLCGYYCVVDTVWFFPQFKS